MNLNFINISTIFHLNRISAIFLTVFLLNIFFTQNFVLLAQNFTNVAGSTNTTIGTVSKEGGLSFGDFNNDGCLDLLVNTGTSSNTALVTRLLQSNCNANPDNITYTDVTSTLAAGLTLQRAERSVVWGDYNNDGYLDFARNTHTRIEIYLNKGPFASPAYSFGDASQNPNYIITNAISPGINAEGMAWADVNGDGWLDLLYDNHNNGVEVYSKDVSGNPCSSGFNLTEGSTIGLINNNSEGDYMVAGDLNDDGWPDLLARKRDAAEDLYINDGDGTFTLNTNFSEISIAKGGVAFCDFDNDGDFDIIWTFDTRNVIYENNGGNPLTFTIHNEGTIAGGNTGINPTESIRGCSCGDVDNDGDIDLFLTGNGGTVYLYKNDLNNGNAFQFIKANGGININAEGMGTVMADYDNDGDLDIYANVNNGLNQLWRSDLITTSTPATDKDYLKVKIVLQNPASAQSNVLGRHLIGATAILRRLPADGGAIVGGIQEINGGTGRGTQSPHVMHFGLPDGPGITYELTVKFPSMNGIRETMVINVTPENLTNHTLVVAKGSSEFGVTACSNTVFLPIELLSFSAKQQADKALIEWSTLTETNNQYFTVERSVNAKDFQEIATIEGAINSSSLQKYSYIDHNPNSGINYYRLKQTDIDGKFSYSHTVAVNMQNDSFKFYPNPANNYLNFKWDGQNPELEINILDYQGKNYISTVISKDNPIVNFDDQLPSGMYILIVETPTKRIIKKLAVRRD